MSRGYERVLRGEGRLIREGIIVCILNVGGEMIDVRVVGDLMGGIGMRDKGGLFAS